MPVEKLKTNNIILMTDADGCLVSNINGNYNLAILSLLEVNKDMISNCAVITGRDMSGLSRLLGSSEFKNSTSNNWKANALGRVEEEIKKAYKGEVVVCITNDLTEGEAGYKNHPGNYYLSYKPIEEDVMKENDAKKALEKLNSVYLRNVSNIEDEVLRGHARKIEKYDDKFHNELPLKGFDSYNKGAQVKFYLESLGNAATNSVKIYIDDVPSNVRAVAEKNSDVIAVLNDVEMGRGYNEQALNLAISFANGNETSYEKLKKGVNDYEVFSNHFAILKDLGIIEKKTSIGDFVRPLVKNEDWFKAVEEFSGFLNGMITEYRAQEADGMPEEARKYFLKENYNEFIKSAKLVPQNNLSYDEEFQLAIALSLKESKQENQFYTGTSGFKIESERAKRIEEADKLFAMELQRKFEEEDRVASAKAGPINRMSNQEVEETTNLVLSEAQNSFAMQKKLHKREEGDTIVAKNLGNPKIGSRAVIEEQRQINERQALDEAMARSLSEEAGVDPEHIQRRESQIRESQIREDRELALRMSISDTVEAGRAGVRANITRPASRAQRPNAEALIGIERGGHQNSL